MQPFKDQTFVDGALWSLLSACLMVVKALESLNFI